MTTVGLVLLAVGGMYLLIGSPRLRGTQQRHVDVGFRRRRVGLAERVRPFVAQPGDDESQSAIDQ